MKKEIIGKVLADLSPDEEYFVEEERVSELVCPICGTKNSVIYLLVEVGEDYSGKIPEGFKKDGGDLEGIVAIEKCSHFSTAEEIFKSPLVMSTTDDWPFSFLADEARERIECDSPFLMGGDAARTFSLIVSAATIFPNKKIRVSGSEGKMNLSIE